jgi:hypothetical protein
MQEFLPGISREIYVFPNPEKNQSRNLENNQHRDITGSKESTDVKSRGRAGNADTRSRRLRSTFPGTGTEERSNLEKHNSALSSMILK